MDLALFNMSAYFQVAHGAAGDARRFSPQLPSGRPSRGGEGGRGIELQLLAVSSRVPGRRPRALPELSTAFELYSCRTAIEHLRVERMSSTRDDGSGREEG